MLDKHEFYVPWLIMNLKGCQNFMIPPNYGFIWEKLQNILLLHEYLRIKTNGVPWHN